MNKGKQVLDILEKYKFVFIDDLLCRILKESHEKVNWEDVKIIQDYFYPTDKKVLYNVIDNETHEVAYTGTEVQCKKFIEKHNNIWTEFILEKA